MAGIGKGRKPTLIFIGQAAKSLFARSTYGAAPVFRQILEFRPGGYLVPPVAFVRIINITAIDSLASPHFIHGTHVLSSCG